ncbi:hypothetical protein MTO96_003580 [Rhipicephalus appendiculatus]
MLWRHTPPLPFQQVSRLLRTLSAQVDPCFPGPACASNRTLFGGPWECPLDLERPLDLDLERLLKRALLCECRVVLLKCSEVREYIKQSTKIVRLECHQRFNYECLNNNVVPRNLYSKTLVDTPYGRKLARDFSRNCLKARIQDNKQQIHQLKMFTNSSKGSRNHRNLSTGVDLCDQWIAIEVDFDKP